MVFSGSSGLGPRCCPPRRVGYRVAGLTGTLLLPTDAYRSPHSPFYQLPPSVPRHGPNPLLVAPTPPALQKLLGEAHPRAPASGLGVWVLWAIAGGSW